MNRPGIGIEGVVYALLNPNSDVIGGLAAYGAVKSLVGAAKLTVNLNGQVVTDYADDGPAVISSATGKIQVSLELNDLSEDAYAELYGVSKVNGVSVDKTIDASPYIALGFKQLLAGAGADGLPVYRYFWLAKGVLSKPQVGGDTKKDTIAYQHMTISGEFARLECNGNAIARARTDNPDLPASMKSGWFNQPVISNTASLTAVTVGTITGDASDDTITIPFAKSGETFKMAAPAAGDILIIVASTGALLSGNSSFAVSAEGIAPTIIVTNTNIAEVAYIVLISSNVKDTNGVHVAATSQSVTPAA